MSKFLYEVMLETGRSNKHFFKFLNNVTELNAKPPDYGGINNICIISHHLDARTIHRLCTDGFEEAKDEVTITEITSASLASIDQMHRLYWDLIENYFLPHGKYSNIRRR